MHFILVVTAPAKESSLRREHPVRRDEEKRTPSEDMRRMPGGFPHRTIAIAAFVSVALAAVLLGALRRDSLFLFIGLGLAIPIVIVLLARLANRQRDRVHPSR